MTINMTAQQRLTAYVDPLIGTDGHGHTYPGASVPFGLVQLSPDTDSQGWDWCSGYHYSDNSIMGFSHTHLSGTGVGDYGDILFMPTTGELKTEPGPKENPDEGYRSRFDHKNETASPGYYSVFLDDYKIKAELTVTTRAGFHKYVYPGTDQAHIIIDLVHGIQDKTTDAEIKFTGNNTISGYRRSTGWAEDHYVYFYAVFSKPFKSYGIAEDGKIIKEKKLSRGKNIKAFVDYSTQEGEEILVKVGISHTSAEGAENNLNAEIPGWEIDKIRKQAESDWEKELSSILIESKDSTGKRIFYTALYHSLLNPNIFSDYDSSYTGMNNRIHKSERNIYTVLSLWDVFRAALPLITITDSNRTNEIIHTLLSKYRESGLLPVWELAANETNTMIGYHSIPVVADAIMKGIGDFDLVEAFDAMKKSAMQDLNGLLSYKEMGFVAADLEGESVSKTLEYAYDDWCISETARYLWKSNILPSAEKDYYYFRERAKSYVNLFNPSTSLFRAKKNGRWFEPFDPYAITNHYTEANAWQYSFFVPHDVNSLIRLMGGDQKFIEMLDKVFNADSTLTGRFQPDVTGLIGQYAHGNEPSHHMAYLFNYAGVPHKTQERVRQVMDQLYTDLPDGLPGNEDCGQMSAWYVFSALGFYPVCPGDNKYIIGTPHFDKVILNKGEENTFIIEAKNLSDKNIYIRNVKLNGKDYPNTFITHQNIVKGGELLFEMDAEPSSWGSLPQSRPLSVNDIGYTTVPYLTSGEKVFRDSVKVELAAIDSSSKIFYSTDGSFPSIAYSGPITLNKTTRFKTAALNKNIYSKVVTSNFYKLPEGRKIKLFSEYSPNYTGGGDNGLIDGIKGTGNFHTDAWQGYEGVDFTAVVDLGKNQKISLINASFLKNTYSWIFYPQLIEYYISEDGEKYTKLFETENSFDEKSAGAGVSDFEKRLEGVNARYVKVYARNVGVCPGWHPGAGGKAWIFIDEITIE